VVEIKSRQHLAKGQKRQKRHKLLKGTPSQGKGSVLPLHLWDIKDNWDAKDIGDACHLISPKSLLSLLSQLSLEARAL